MNKHRVFEIFEDILKIPRESGNENEIANYIVNFANNLSCETYKDKINNVFIRKNNNSKNTIILQAHSDMVCVSTNNYDFKNKGIPFFIEGDLYKSKNTSLGADDGIGIAIILAILEENENMPNIEAIVTVQEETTMKGAFEFDYSKITGKTLISLDGIKEGDIECSSSGMCSITLKKKLIQEKKNFERYILKISNLAGGHSGDDINKNRCNAIKLAATILSKLNIKNIIDINIGEKDNAIPSNGYVIFETEQELSCLRKIAQNIDLKLTDDDKNLNIEIDKVDNLALLSIINTYEIIDFLNEFEDGLLEVYEADKFPELSANIGKISINQNDLEIKLSIRSSVKKLETKQLNKVKDLCIKYKFEFILDSIKPFFPYKEESKIRKLLMKTYKELYKRDAVIKKIHACMEGGILSSKIQDLDICTIAPDINNCHTVNENVSIESTIRVYEWLKKTLECY